MKKLSSIFVSLLFIALVIILSGCNDTSNEVYIEPTVVSVQHIEIEESEPYVLETIPTVETEPEIIDEDTTFEISFVNDGEVMPYALVSPSTVDEEDSLPLIVWLHERDEQHLSEEDFMQKGLAGIMANWELETFKAYVICPQMKNSFYSTSWCTAKVEKNLANLLDKFILEHNVDQNKIIVAGLGLGGQGTIYMSVKLSDYFSRAVVFSGYASSVPCSSIEIPTNGYVGRAELGEGPSMIRFMRDSFAPEVNCHFEIIDSSHNDLPKVVLNIDKNQDGKSDLVEWMFSD